MDQSIEEVIHLALPRRAFRIQPKILVQRIAEVIRPWQGADSEASRRYDKETAAGSRKMRATFKTAVIVVRKCQAKLEKLLVLHEEHDARTELGRILESTRKRLDTWERTHPKRGRGRIKKLSTVLTEQLFYLLRRHADFTSSEYESFLECISGQLEVPKLSAATLKKRAYRDRKKSRRSAPGTKLPRNT